MKSAMNHFCLLGLMAVIGTLIGACASTEERRATGEYIDDTAINARVKTALLRDDQVGGFDVSTTTYDRVVQLSGFVDNEEQKQRAGEIASQVQGVQQVVNNITVNPRAQEGEDPPPRQR